MPDVIIMVIAIVKQAELTETGIVSVDVLIRWLVTIIAILTLPKVTVCIIPILSEHNLTLSSMIESWKVRGLKPKL